MRGIDIVSLDFIKVVEFKKKMYFCTIKQDEND